MKSINLVFALLSSIYIYSQDSTSILFIGNSYVYTNDLPTVFKNLTISLGDMVTVDSKTNGGYTFQNHVNDPLTFQKIHSQPWDYVVLQGQSQEPSFPYDQVNTMTLPYAVQLADSVYANAPCSQAMYFMTWGRQVGDPQWDSINTFNKMNLRLRNAYLRIADSAQASVSPSGPAWKYVIDNYPTINLFSTDGSHPNFAGTYLSACVFYSSVFHKSPEGASFIGTLDQPTATILQQVAAITVLDSISTWKLKHHDSLTQVQFTSNPLVQSNQIQFNSTNENVDSLTWYFGDDTFSFNQNPMHEYMYNGTYIVTLVGTGACGSDTVYQTINITTANTDLVIKNDLKCFINSDGYLEINSTNEKIDIYDLALFSINGDEIPCEIYKTTENNYLVKFNSKGIIQLNFKENKSVYNLKLFVP